MDQVTAETIILAVFLIFCVFIAVIAGYIFSRIDNHQPKE
jgi:hypothetical protein